MWSTILGFVLSVSCVLAAPGGASSFSSSSSSAGSGSGVSGGFFQFPTQMPFFPFHAPAPGGFPAFDFNNMFQQFVSTANAAHGFAAQNPAYAKVFQEQMALLASMQQMAFAQYPFAFPGFDVSNSISTDNLGSGSGAWAGQTGGGSTGGPTSVFTSGAVNYGPHGGFGMASAAPGGPDGLGVRISEEFPAPSGGGFGTFSSSSSGISSVNGKTTSFKQSTIGVNDNGKITFRTVSE